jgi:CspA family cold shock protein
MPKGNVKWFDEKKGYGFITTGEEEDIFVHFSEIQGEGFKTLKEGDEVEFEISENDKGKYATKVTRV